MYKYFRQIAIEPTRRCNMSCPHCMRGDAQAKDITKEMIDEILYKLRGISVITFGIGGGEPSLAPDLVDYIIGSLAKYDIDVDEIIIPTNGKNYSDEFINILNKWGKTYKIDCFLSIDKHHNQLTDYDWSQLNKLDCVHTRRDYNNHLLYMGRAKNLKSEEIDFSNYTMWGIKVVKARDLNIMYNILYFTAEGDLLSACDYEYGQEDKVKICSYKDDIMKVLSTCEKEFRNIDEVDGSNYYYQWFDYLKKKGRL